MKNIETVLQCKKNPGKWEKKYIQKTKRYCGFLKIFPAIEMIAIGNSIAMNCAKKSSDIDLYIVTKEHSLWTVRIFLTFYFQVLGVRKTDKKHTGRFCLSFFSTRAGMDFGVFRLKNDPYLDFWIATLIPIVNKNNCYEEFLSLNTKKQKKSSKNLGASKKNGIIEKFLKKIFLPRTLKHYKLLGKPYGIIISDTLLKFHNNDIRKEIADKTSTTSL